MKNLIFNPEAQCCLYIYMKLRTQTSESPYPHKHPTTTCPVNKPTCNCIFCRNPVTPRLLCHMCALLLAPMHSDPFYSVLRYIPTTSISPESPFLARSSLAQLFQYRTPICRRLHFQLSSAKSTNSTSPNTIISMLWRGGYCSAEVGLWLLARPWPKTPKGPRQHID